MATEVRVNHTTKNIIWKSVQVISMSILPFIVRTVMMHYWGLEYVGLNSLFTSILSVLNLSELGFGQALVFSMYAPAANKDNDKMCELLSIYNLFYIFFGLIILLVGIIIIPFLPHLIHGTYPTDINISLVYLIFLLQTVSGYFLFAYVEAAYIANQDISVNSKVSTVIWTLAYSAQILLVVCMKNYYLYAATIPIATIMVCVLCACFLHKDFPDYHLVKITKETFPKSFWVDFGKRNIGVALNKVRDACRTTVDTLVISKVMGLATVAIYNNYLMVMAIPYMLITSICNAILPSLGNGVALEDKENNYAVKKLISLLINFVSTITITCLIIFYQGFMTLWAGEENVASPCVAILFCVLLYLYSLEQVNIIIRNASGVWWFGKWVPVVETVLNLSFNFIFISLWGMEGIILATIISMILINIPFETYYIYKFYYEKKPWKDLLGILIDTVISFIAILLAYMIAHLYQGEILSTIIIWGLCALIIPSIVLIVCHIKDIRMWEIFDIIKSIVFKKKKTKNGD